MAAPNWDDIRVFLTVARHGSYRRAATELGMTQPSISNRIDRLEATLRVALFDKTMRGVELTADGKRVLSHASSAELSLSKALSIVQMASDNAEGECKIGVGDGLGGAWMPFFLPSFLAHNPNIKLSILTTNDRAINKKPLYDLQIQYQLPLEQNLVSVKLADLHFTLFATQSYIDAYGMPAGQDDLAHHRILDLSLALTEKGTLSSWAGMTDSAILFTNSSVALAEAVWAGTGIGLLPTYAGAIDPELVAVLPQLHFPAPVYVCFEREVGQRPAVRAALNFLKEAVFNRHTMPWFLEAYHHPEPAWRSMLTSHLARLNPSLVPLVRERRQHQSSKKKPKGKKS